MKTRLNQYIRFADHLSYYVGHFGGIVFLAGIVILVTLEVILRTFFSTSTLVSDEFSAYFFIGLLYFGASYTLSKQRHITINIVTLRVSDRLRLIFFRFTTILTLPVCFVICWRGWELLATTIQHGTLAATVMATPLYLPMLIVPLGLSVLALQALAEVFRLFVTVDEQGQAKWIIR
jgi:TRAP-type C4-dicarboxylate transport system permease small subunit